MFSVELTLSDSNGETYKVIDGDRWTPVWFYSTSGTLKCQDHDYRRCPHILAVIKERGGAYEKFNRPSGGAVKTGVLKDDETFSTSYPTITI